MAARDFDILLTKRDGFIVLVDGPPKVKELFHSLMSTRDDDKKDLRLRESYAPGLLQDWWKEGYSFAFDGGQ